MADPHKQFTCDHAEAFSVYSCGDEECTGIHVDQLTNGKVNGSILIPRGVVPQVAAMLMDRLDDKTKIGLQ